MCLASGPVDPWGPHVNGLDLGFLFYSFQENDANFEKSFLEF
jgi:hypothetical protein